MDVSERYNVERKKSDTKEYTQYDSMYIKFENKPKKSIVMEVRRVGVGCWLRGGPKVQPGMLEMLCILTWVGI